MPDGVLVLDARQPHRMDEPLGRDPLRPHLQGRPRAARSPTSSATRPSWATSTRSTTASRSRSRAPGETERVLSVQLVPYGNHEKLLLSRDVTRWERLESMRRDFIANVSHELRTPLTVMKGFLETLTDATRCRREALPPLARADDRPGRAHAAPRRGPPHALAPRGFALPAARGDHRRRRRSCSRCSIEAESLNRRPAPHRLPDRAGVARRQPRGDPQRLLQPGHQRDPLHAGRRRDPGHLGASRTASRRCACATTARASRPSTSRASPSASTASTAAARAPPAAPGWGSPS